MKKRIVSLLLALALLVLPVVSAGAAQPAAADPTPVQTQTDAAAESDQHCYSYIALGDSIVAGIGLPDAVYQRNGRYYDVSGNYQGYSKDCYVARVADSLGLSRAQTANYGMPALMSSDLLELVYGVDGETPVSECQHKFCSAQPAPGAEARSGDHGGDRCQRRTGAYHVRHCLCHGRPPGL